MLNIELQGDDQALVVEKEELTRLMSDATHSYIEYALDFSNAGFYEEADRLLSYIINDENEVYPMVYYALGYFASQAGNKEVALAYFKLAAKMKPDYCFPNKLEEVLMLQKAMEINSEDAKAPYYLGNFWYGARQYDDAITCWEKSVALDDTFPTVQRNLSLAYYNKRNNVEMALKYIERAFELDKSDARILMELDQLYKKLQRSHESRLALLESHFDLVEQRDDLCVERISLYNQLGMFEKAKLLMAARKFHPWEGGEGKVTGQFVISILELAKQAIQEGRFDDAINLLKETEHYPQNLGEGKLSTKEENDIHYYLGCAYEGLGKMEKALEYFRKATLGTSEPTIAYYYNDQQPDLIFYQGMAWRKLGEEEKAKDKFIRLIEHGRKHMHDNVRIDYFAVSLPDLLIWEDDLNQRNQIHCHFVMALGYLGLGENERAKQNFEKLRALDINHQGVNILNFDFQEISSFVK
jgi:tetratricopeptide (TPR) repeat protein